MIKSINIKDNWKLTKVKNHLKKKPNAIVDGPFGTQLHNDEYVKMGIPVVRITNLDYNCDFNPKNLVYITEQKYKELKRSSIENGDIIIGKTGATIGKSGIFNGFEKGIVSSSCLKISLDDTILSNFFRFVVVSDFFKEEIYNESSGSTRDTINISEMKNIEFFIPSTIEEQKQIAKYLDKKTTKIEQTITKNKKLITLLKEKKTSLINQTVTKGLNPDAPMKESGIEWIGKIPKHWNIIPFKRVLNFIKDGTHGSFERVNEGEFLLSAKNVQNNKIIINENESIISKNDYKSIVKNGFPKKGDLLVTIVGTLGRSCVYELEKNYAFQRSVAFLRLKKHYNPYYYSYLIQTSFYQNELDSLSKQSAQKGVYLNDIWESIILNPSPQEQNQIAEYLDKETKKIDNTIEKIERNIELLEEYKESLIHHVVTGKIDVRGVEV